MGYAIRNVLTLLWEDLPELSRSNRIPQELVDDQATEELVKDPIILIYVFTHFCWIAVAATENIDVDLRKEIEAAMDYMAAYMQLEWDESFVIPPKDSVSSPDPREDYLFSASRILREQLGLRSEGLESIMQNLGPNLPISDSSTLEEESLDSEENYSSTSTSRADSSLHPPPHHPAQTILEDPPLLGLKEHSQDI